MEKRNVETWYCKRDGPVTRVGGRNPGLRHWAPRGRCDVLIGNGGLRGPQANVGSVLPGGADAAYCAQRWAYYDRASRESYGDDGRWRPCP